MPGVKVAEEGNRRRGDMNTDEINQCVKDIVLWFRRNGCNAEDGAESNRFQSLEKASDLRVPIALETLLKEVNGGIWFMEKKLMSINEIIDCISEVDSSSLWKRYLIPFCGDSSDMIVIDTNTDEVLEWDADDGLGDSLSKNLSSYLEDFRNNLISGKFEYMDDLGVIEKVTSRPGK